MPFKENGSKDPFQETCRERILIGHHKSIILSQIMSCYHMNVALMQDNAVIRKKDQRLGSFAHKIIFSNDKTQFRGYEYYMKVNEKNKKNGEPYTYKFIPCGKCIGCRTEERKNWAIRIEKEAKQYDHNYFITLTYNDEHLEIPDYKDVTLKNGQRLRYYNNGSWNGTVNKKHFSQFIKSLRTYFEREFDHQGLKFYGVSEYGDLNQRPHYHIILMNCPNLDPYLEPVGHNKKTGDPYYTIPRIEHIWGKGFITIGKVTWDSISYTAGYCAKKLFGEVKELHYAKKGQDPIFANMSRRPGIGREWYEQNKDKIYDYDEIINSKGIGVKIPRYFDKLTDIGDDDEYELLRAIKRVREQNSENETKKRMSQTSKTLKEQMLIEEKTAKDKQIQYNRNRIKNAIY